MKGARERRNKPAKQGDRVGGHRAVRPPGCTLTCQTNASWRWKQYCREHQGASSIKLLVSWWGCDPQMASI
jgi:hypothetical protein